MYIISMYVYMYVCMYACMYAFMDGCIYMTGSNRMHACENLYASRI